MLLRFGIAAVTCGLAVCAAGCSRSIEQPAYAAAGKTAVAEISVELAAVAKSDVTASIELVGSLIPRRRSIIVSEVDGVIAEIPSSQTERIEAEVDGQRFSAVPRLDIGVEVAQGDVLARLDPTQYQLKLQADQAKLDTTKRELENLRAWRRPEEVKKSQAGRDEAAARLALAKSNRARSQGLFARKAIARAEFEQTEMELKAARAALDRADAELALAGAGPTKEEVAVGLAAVAQARAEVEQAQWELEKTIIRAPYDGVVTDRYVDEGERVTAMPRVEIMELMNLSVLSARLCVPERYINQVRVGQTAEVYVKGSVQPVRGLVVLINDKVDPAGRTFRIRVAVDNRQRRFKVGQFVRVVLQVDGAADTLTVPTRAIVYTGGEARVFVYSEGSVQQKAVELGLRNPTAAEVLSGLAAGEQVVVDDPSILSPGMSVQVRPTDPQTTP